MHEGKFTTRLLKEINELRQDVVVFKIHGHVMQQNGIPDFFVAWNGIVGWIEVKSETGRLSPIQRRLITDLRSQGCLVCELRYYEVEEGYLLHLAPDGVSHYERLAVRLSDIGRVFLELLKAVNGIRKDKECESPPSSAT